MGTRADFYVGNGENAEWIGSVAWDGYEWGDRIEAGDHDSITAAKTEDEFRLAVGSMLSKRTDGTKPEDGWPWPWDNSFLTDCAYCFSNTGVEAFKYGRPWHEDCGKKVCWPDMKSLKNVTIGRRSGLIVIQR